MGKKSGKDRLVRPDFLKGMGRFSLINIQKLGEYMYQHLPGLDKDECQRLAYGLWASQWEVKDIWRQLKYFHDTGEWKDA